MGHSGDECPQNTHTQTHTPTHSPHTLTQKQLNQLKIRYRFNLLSSLDLDIKRLMSHFPCPMPPQDLPSYFSAIQETVLDKKTIITNQFFAMVFAFPRQKHEQISYLI